MVLRAWAAWVGVASVVACSASSGTSGGDVGDAAICTMPGDIQGMRLEGAAMTSAGGETALYVVVEPDRGSSAEVRRYVLAGTSPCAFTRDDAFGAKPTKAGAVAADDQGHVFVANIDGVARVAPGEPVTCEAPETARFSSAPAFAMRRDGTTGVIAEPATLYRLTVEGDACTVRYLTTRSADLTDVSSVALDASGRMHLGQDGSGSRDGHVVLLDRDGVLVKTYETGRSDVKTVTGMTACKTGICLDAFSAYVALDADGNVVGTKRLERPLPAGVRSSNFVRIVGAPDAPAVFAAGTGGPSTQVLVYMLTGLVP